jgi:L-ribulokinase
MACPDLKVYQPNPRNASAYTALYREYKKLHDYFGKENMVMERLGSML